MNYIKIFGVDVFAKHISFEMEGRQFSILFRDNPWKGVHDISIWTDNGEADVKIIGKYPPLKDVVSELWQVHFPLWVKRKVRRCRQLRNR